MKRERKKTHTYTSDQLEFLKSNVAGIYYKDLTAMFNERFQTNLSTKAVKAKCNRLKIVNGFDGRFRKGQVPVNKGKKYPGKTNATSFNKGNKPANYKPVGTERVDRDGYILIKVQDHGKWNERWRHKHKVIWEKVNGMVPKGHCIMFLDGNKQNITLENLKLITNGQLGQMNRNRLLSGGEREQALTEAAITIADIQLKVAEHKRKNKEK